MTFQTAGVIQTTKHAIWFASTASLQPLLCNIEVHASTCRWTYNILLQVQKS